MQNALNSTALYNVLYYCLMEHPKGQTLLSGPFLKFLLSLPYKPFKNNSPSQSILPHQDLMMKINHQLPYPMIPLVTSPQINIPKSLYVGTYHLPYKLAYTTTFNFVL